MVNRTERGWAGHYCASDSCKFRRNTLLEKDGVYVVVSSVGNQVVAGEYKTTEVGCGRYYETVAYYSADWDSNFHDIDVSRSISVTGKQHICKMHDLVDNEANEMHENVVLEISERLEKGEL